MSSSKRWLHEHFNDYYVRQAQAQGYPSRAAYKLLELQKKYGFLRRGMRVIDLGAAPGGWSMVASELIGSTGRVIAVDCLPMQPMAGVEFIQGDFTQESVFTQLLAAAGADHFDLVLSDMAPNISGCKSIDQPRIMYLAELAWDCAQQLLVPGGCFLVKLFQGGEVDVFTKTLRSYFKQVTFAKPKASRARSAEIYLLARGFIRI